MQRETLFLTLAIIGFITPSILVFAESIETGNILLYTNPLVTVKAMFTNRISTIFMIDLLYGVIVFFIWTYFDSKKLNIKKVWRIWMFTLLFGLAGGFPLYLYEREKSVHAAE